MPTQTIQPSETALTASQSTPQSASVARLPASTVSGEPAGTLGAPGDVLISQVLYDPGQGVADPGGEWIVLWNPSGKTVQMVGWKLRDSQGEEALPVIELPAGATVLVAAAHAAGSTLPPTTLRVTLPGHIANGLRNDGDSLTLLDSSGHALDALSWGNDRTVFDPAVPLAQAGQPLQRIGITDTDSAGDWLAAVEPPVAAVQAPISTATPMPSPTTDGQPQVTGPTIPSTATVDTPVIETRTTGRVILSEIAPHDGWVELYNPGPEAVDLEQWSLADGRGVATVMLPGVVPVAPNSFIVVQAAALNLTRPDTSIALRNPTGAVVDMVAVAPVKENRSLSRFPVQGGGWTLDTPLTAGQFNQPASGPEQSPLPTPTQSQGGATLLAASPQPGLFKPWMLGIPAVFLASLALLLALWRRRAP